MAKRPSGRGPGLKHRKHKKKLVALEVRGESYGGWPYPPEGASNPEGSAPPRRQRLTGLFSALKGLEASISMGEGPALNVETDACRADVVCERRMSAHGSASIALACGRRCIFRAQSPMRRCGT
eukprot:2039512-Rhodomonas_salina.1